MVEKATEKWPQLEDKPAHIQEHVKPVDRRDTASARQKKGLTEELARAKTSGEDEVLATKCLNVLQPMVTQHTYV